MFKHLKSDYAESQHLIHIYAIASLIGNSLFFLLNQEHFESHESIPLRGIAIFLSLALLSKNYWPAHLKVYLPLFWFSSLTFMLPFLFSYLALVNHFTSIWQINIIICMVILTLLVNWYTLAIIIAIGSSAAFITFYCSSSEPLSFDPTNTILGIFSIILYFTLFSKKNKIHQSQRLATLRALSGSIAHEMRTPLNSIHASASSIKDNLDILIESYILAKEAGLKVKRVKKSDLSELMKAPDSLIRTSNQANTIIDMLLTKIQTPQFIGQLDTCSINECIEFALSSFPMNDKDRKKIHWEKGNDFEFLGKTSLFIHVIFNLLKNALHFIQTEGKGEVTIWADKDGNRNVLRFQDTSKGIPQYKLSRIFDPFYSESEHGTGIGLAFCKLVMKEFEGDIRCESVDGEYTEFVLSFPASSQFKS